MTSVQAPAWAERIMADQLGEIERLRTQVRHYEEGWKAWRDEEERLRKELARYREATA